MKNRDPYFLAHVNFQVLGGGGDYSAANSLSTQVSETPLVSPNQGFRGTVYIPLPPPPAAAAPPAPPTVVGMVWTPAALIKRG